MAASSTQGTGQGSVGANNKGSDRASLAVEKLIGARVVKAGSATLVSASPSTAAVVFDVALSGVVGDYIVITTPVGATAAIAAGGAAISSFTTAGFTITGPNTVTTVIQWLVIKIK